MFEGRLDRETGVRDDGIEYRLYEGPELANQNNRKLGVFDRKLEGSCSLLR